MMECNTNTEIVVHDNGSRLASLMYYEGDNTNKITIGRNMGWSAISDIVLNGNVSFSGEIKNSHWKLTNQSDYCRLYNNAGTAYFNFAAREVWAETALSVGTTASIGGDTNIGGSVRCSGVLQTGNQLAIRGSAEWDTATLFLATPHNSSSAYKCALIAQGMNTWGRSKLHFCLNNVESNTFPTQNANLSNSRMVIDYNGRVGISNTNPQSMLHLGNCEVINSAPVIVF